MPPTALITLDTPWAAGTVLAPLLVLSLPIALTLWFRRKAVSAPPEARASVWFWCFRYLRYLNLGAIALWWVATDSVGLKTSAGLFWRTHVPQAIPAQGALFLLCFWFPLIAVLVFCQMLFQPVYSKIREVHWTRRELARQAACGLGMSLVPVLCVVGGVSDIGQSSSPFGLVVSFVLAAVFWIASARALRRHLQLTPNALTTGELRDRAFSLAAQLRVKLQQLYLLPPGRARLANAFARSGNSILLTEVLLANLNKREVDSVIGHELSHLKHDHPRMLGFALTGGLAAVGVPYLTLFAFGSSTLFGFSSSSLQPLFDLLFICVPLLAFYFVARRFEYTADAGSVKLTGDPAAMITALVKLHHLNLMPLEWSKWSEKTMTHPSTLRRARAIGHAAGISETRINELLATPAAPAVASPSDYYALPAHSSSAAGKVFSTAFKQRSAWRFYLGFIALAIIFPSVLLRGLDALNWPGTGFLSFLVALAFCVGASLWFSNTAPFFGYRGLCRRLRAKFAAEGVPVDSSAAILVGLSPGDSPRVFESNYSWDTGCLMFCSDRLCYWGEETRFAIRREQITSVRLGEGIPSWFRAQFLYLTWRAEDDGRAETTFNLRPIDVRSVLTLKRALSTFEHRLQAWRTAANSPDSVPPPFESLQPPQIGEVTSTSIYAARRSRQTVALVMLVCMISGFVASLFNLPVEWIAPPFMVPEEHIYAGVSGWYAVLISLILLLFSFGPFWFARKPRERARVPVPPPPVPARNSGQSPVS